MRLKLLPPIFVCLTAIVSTNCFAGTNIGSPQTEVTVKVASIEKRTIAKYVEAYGLVEPEPAIKGKPSASSKVSSPVAGLLTKVLCEEGQYVNQSDVLFELDARSANEAVGKAVVAVEYAQKNFERKQFLYSNNNTSLKLYKDAEQLLETAKKDLSNANTQREILRIKAPLSGTISAINLKTGEAVGVNTVLADLMDLKRLDVALKVPSKEAYELHLGQSAEVSVDSLTFNRPYAGKVIFISPQVDPTTDTVLVRASFAGDDLIRPGQFVQARVNVLNLQDRLSVPVASVVHGDAGDYLMLVAGHTAKQQSIKTGIKDKGFIEVSGSSLKAGMTVVTEGAYALPAETNIRIQK